MPMNMDLSLYQRLEMRMRLAPQIIQSIEILQLPTLELQQRINQELLENPVLEQLEPEVEETPAEEAEEARSEDEADFDKMEEMEESWRDYSSQSPARHGDLDRDPKLEAMQNTAARGLSLQEHLASQLSLLETDPAVRVIAENIIYNIDDNGYLQYPLQEILESLPPGTTLEQAEQALKVVQALEPPGVGARDLKECLTLQLTGDGGWELERLLIQSHLEDLQMNRYPKIVKETGRTLEEIREAADFVCHLSPRPGALFSSEPPHYVLPDVKIEEVDGTYEVRMSDDYLPRLRVSRQYLTILKSKDSSAEEKDYIKKKLQSAKWLIDSITQRRTTLRKIMEEIVKCQREFFDKGVQFLKPLKMATVAEAAHVHVSTVSRAIADKYVETPRGLFEIKYFFTGSAQADDDGSGASRVSVQELVREAVAGEDKRKPLSDGEIVDILKNKDIDVARRTVTKYRRILNIPSSRQRMQY